MYKLCKTEQSAARQRELEQSLMVLMNTCRYEEISVSDFCIHAGIPRKAFYRYFSSKDGALYALLDHTLLEYEASAAPYVPGGKRSILRELEMFFLFWKERKPLLDALEHSGLSGILMERAISFVTGNALVSRLLPEEDAKIRDHIIHFCTCGLMIMMVNWHHGGYQESTQEMAQIAARLVTRPLFPMAKKLL